MMNYVGGYYNTPFMANPFPNYTPSATTQQTTDVQSQSIYPQPQTQEVKDTQETKKKVNISNKDLIWAGITGLAILGTYLVTRGHFKKLNIPKGSTAAADSAATAATNAATETVPKINQAVTDYIGSYKPLEGLGKPNVAQIGSRTRADFSGVVNGEQVRETLIFNSENKPVQRLVEKISQDGKRTREAYKMTDGEFKLVQKSSRTITQQPERNAQYERLTIENVTVDKPSKDLPDGSGPDLNSNVREVSFCRTRDKKSGKTIMQDTNRSYINSAGEDIPWTGTRTIYGRDKNGKLKAVYTENPTHEYGNRDKYLLLYDENGKLISKRKLNLMDWNMVSQGHINYPEGVKPSHTMTDEEAGFFSGFQEYLASGRKK